MRNIIKRWLILLFLSLQVPTMCLSQTTFDSTEVKEIALIFAEHQKLSVENPLLKQQISSLEGLNQLYIKSDSIQKAELDLFKNKVASDEKKIQRMKSTQKKTVLGFSAGGIVLFILGLLL